jgi:hypothetical protein
VLAMTGDALEDNGAKGKSRLYVILLVTCMSAVMGT